MRNCRVSALCIQLNTNEPPFSSDNDDEALCAESHNKNMISDKEIIVLKSKSEENMKKKSKKNTAHFIFLCTDEYKFDVKQN